MKIIEAQLPDMGVVQNLFREYQSWLNVDICFQGFEEELTALPGRYSSPKGAIYLAFDEQRAVACAAIRPRTDKADSEAELKRLYVQEEYRGRGIGREIFYTAMTSVQGMDYTSVVLETLPIMTAAKSLYLGYGFKNIPAYFANADESIEFYRYRFE
jgi:ribosomal protein S18 acetylase RimI-like enzyme